MREQGQGSEWILSCQWNFEVKVGMHQAPVLSPFVFAVVVDAVTELVRVGVLYELMYADDLLLISETIEGLRNMF